MSRAAHGKISAFFRPPFSLCEAEQVHIMLLPHLHLAQLLASGQWSLAHIAPVASVFNVALALAYLNRDTRSVSYYGAVQNLIVELTNGRPFAAEEQRRLRRGFAEADKYVCAQKKADILYAIRMVEYQAENGPPDDVTDLGVVPENGIAG